MSQFVEVKMKIPKKLKAGRTTEVFEDEAVRALTLSGIEVEGAGKGEAPTGATGNLAAGIEYDVDAPNLLVKISPKVKYGEDVETGTDPHFASKSALTLWAKRKFSVGDKEASRIAFFVQRNIAAKGTKANPFMNRAKEKSMSAIDTFFKAAERNIVRELGRG